MTPIRPGSQGRTEVSFQHTHHGLDLPALTIQLFWETGSHQLAVFGSWHSCTLPANGGRNDSADSTSFPGMHMVGFAVITGISSEIFDALLYCRFFKSSLVMSTIKPRPPFGDTTQHNMVSRITDNPDLGKPRVMDGLVAFFSGSLLALNEIFADVMRLKAGAIQSGQVNISLHELVLGGNHQHAFHKLPHFSFGQQVLSRFLQGGKVRYFFKLQYFS